MTTQAKQKLAVAVAAALAVGVLVYLALPGVFGKRTQQNTNDAFVSADYTLVVPRVAGFIKGSAGGRQPASEGRTVAGADR
jgi:membrane fusion protein (multidrug efflux system)